MKTFSAVAIAAVVVAQATPALACFRFQYAPAVAEARVRWADGTWRPVTIKVRKTRVRFEAADPRVPWGRTVVIGDIANGRAAIFPMSVSGPVPKEAQVTWRTSLSTALAEISLSDTMIGRTPFSDAPLVRNGNLPCRPAANLERQTNDPTVCVLDEETYAYGQALPAFASSPSGERYFQLARMEKREVAADEFKAPGNFPVSFKRPAYLKSWNCSGMGLDPFR